MLMYMFKLNLALLLLVGCYKLTVSRDTFFGYRRMALWGAMVLSAWVPLLNLQGVFRESEAAVVMASAYADYVHTVTPAHAAAMPTWADVLVGVYLVGLAVLLLRFVVQLWGVLKLVRVLPVVCVDGMRLRVLPEGQGPFSFFGWVFVSRSDMALPHFREILIHEYTHVSQLHSADVVLAELFCMANWFNPAGWMLRREVRLNLEYLADEAVVRGGCARKPYQYHLLAMACGGPGQGLANNFNVLPLKKRIAMMNKRRTREMGKVKYLLFVPMTAALLAVSNVELLARSLSGASPELEQLSNRVGQVLHAAAAAPESAVAPIATLLAGAEAAEPEMPTMPANTSKVFMVVEDMPQFPGGVTALMKYLADNVKYPVEAQKAKVEGRVIVQFVVEKDGAVTNVHVIRSASELFDAEALRVVSAMPKWKPGTQNGKPARMQFNIPIMFRLNTDKPAPQNTGESTPEAPLTPQNPYVEVDGKEVSWQEFKAMPQSNIESVYVLKDDNARKPYGEKGRNGVVLVKTKK